MIEFIIGKHKRAKVNPPRVPIHPTKDVDKDMNLFETYRDLKLRWKKTTKSRKNKVKIARKWRQPYYFNPTNQPTCMFVLHENLPRTRNDKVFYKDDEKEYLPLKIELDESHNFDVYPPQSVVDDVKNMKVETFCIFKSSPIHQHKVTKGDIVQIERLKRRNAGDKVTFGTVLLVGSKYWTIIGKPTVPYAKVEATVEQQTLCGDQLSFKYRKSRRISRFLRVRHWVTVLRIDNIVVDPSMEINTEHKASRLLDLWSNRWLYTEELEGLNKTMDISQEIYDGSEHQPGYYNDMGLSESYRWYPDPYAKRGIK
ncbi:50S ribosomal protein L21 [Theileria orientalis]|uniref:Large ribosomal subunit protein bL21m n=1 Tax=Theileria orientalis TaxID=68886 RepID=A0A976ME38_THEOR|nr:50S ribosomal protein L21 [Theileria orientalis]